MTSMLNRVFPASTETDNDHMPTHPAALVRNYLKMEYEYSPALRGTAARSSVHERIDTLNTVFHIIGSGRVKKEHLASG